MESLNVFFEQTLVGIIKLDHNRSFSFQYSKNWLDAPDAFPLSISLPLLCTDMYEGLTKRLAMKIGGENRPGWIKARHWEGLAADVKIGPAVLKKQLSAFCRQCAVTVDSTYLKFTLKDNTGHNRVVIGYSDKRGAFIINDPSRLGPNHEIPYIEFEKLWSRIATYEPGPQNKIYLVMPLKN